MPKSKAFAGIKRDVLAIVATIPTGRVTTFKAIGAFMDVVPRHVAYILATLTDEERTAVPWQRAVGEKGKLGKAKFDGAGRSQQELLEMEGIAIAKGKVEDFDKLFVDAAELEHAVTPKKRYLDEEQE